MLSWHQGVASTILYQKGQSAQQLLNRLMVMVHAKVRSAFI